MIHWIKFNVVGRWALPYSPARFFCSLTPRRKSVICGDRGCG